jgi:hypothetical protein
VSYGPFNMRNEVDVHTTTVGGHFNNTHFLTGDGGYIQILLNGYGGLMLAHQSGMQLNRPVIPEGATSLQVRGMSYLNSTLDFWTDGVVMQWNASGPVKLCLFSPPAGQGASLCLTSVVANVTVQTFFDGFEPNDTHGRLGPCSAACP